MIPMNANYLFRISLYLRLIYATDNPFPLLILRDVRDEGLSSSRFPPDELEDSKLIIQRLAQFHAASFFLAENVGE